VSREPTVWVHTVTYTVVHVGEGQPEGYVCSGRRGGGWGERRAVKIGVMSAAYSEEQPGGRDQEAALDSFPSSLEPSRLFNRLPRTRATVAIIVNLAL
jgi:hypothetical protein